MQGLGQRVAGPSGWHPAQAQVFGEAGLGFRSNSLDKGAGRWAEGVLSLERRRVGMMTHCFDLKPGYMAGGQSGSRVTPLNAGCCMPGKHALLLRTSQQGSLTGMNNSAARSQLG